jgi:hypothetical protein
VFTKQLMRWPAVVAIAVMMAAALRISAPVPASATVPNREIVAASSASNSADKGVTVTCPEGTQRLAAGADVAGAGSSYVIIDDLIPGPRNVTAYGYEYAAYGTSLTWSIRVWAVCGTLSTTVYTYAQTSTNDIDDFKTASVDCPSTMVVLGAGYALTGAQGGALATAMIPARDGVEVEAYEVDLGPGNPGSWSVTAYAICAEDPGGRSQVSRTTSTSSDQERFGDATCPTGKEAFGTGFELNGFRGRLNLTDLYPTNVGIVRTYASELVATTNDWSMTTFVVCATE